eukprot:3189492-Amphidinium_carterae.1
MASIQIVDVNRACTAHAERVLVHHGDAQLRVSVIRIKVQLHTLLQKNLRIKFLHPLCHSIGDQMQQLTAQDILQHQCSVQREDHSCFMEEHSGSKEQLLQGQNWKRKGP